MKSEQAKNPSVSLGPEQTRSIIDYLARLDSHLRTHFQTLDDGLNSMSVGLRSSTEAVPVDADQEGSERG